MPYVAKYAEDVLEAITEIFEHEEYVRCQWCGQMETLSFMNGRLNSGLKKWMQLPSGKVIHLCAKGRVPKSS